MNMNMIKYREIVAGASSFEDGTDRLVRGTGMSRGRAILINRQIDGKNYNSWLARKWQTDNGRMQHL
jgi:hypothetical protein